MLQLLSNKFIEIHDKDHKDGKKDNMILATALPCSDTNSMDSASSNKSNCFRYNNCQTKNRNTFIKTVLQLK